MIDLEALLIEQEPRIARGFIAMIANMKREVNMAELEALIESGQMHEALALVLRSAPNVATASGVAFMAAARETAKQMGSDLDAVVIDFDVTSPNTTDAMRDMQLGLVDSFTEGQRQATQAAIVAGILAGLTPREQAQRFRDSIGLTATQQRAVDNYERALKGASRDALGNALRNKGDDAAVRAAAAAGEALPAARIERMVERYRQRMIAHRAAVIARTEALRSVNSGMDAMFEQAFASGELEREQTVQTWITAKDERVRGTHRTMHGQQRLLGEPFVSGAGNLLMRPGDSRAPISETINCRCHRTITIKVRVT